MLLDMQRRISMKKGFLSLCVICALIGIVQSSNKPNSRSQSVAQSKMERAIQQIESFKPARELLLKEKVPFEPNVLLSRSWRKLLAGTLARMPQMKMVRSESQALNGAYLADLVYLPDRIILTGDTVILANKVVFEGNDVLIRGNHDIHILPVEQIGTPQDFVRSPESEVKGTFLKANFINHPDRLRGSRLQSAHITIDVSAGST